MTSRRPLAARARSGAPVRGGAAFPPTGPRPPGGERAVGGVALALALALLLGVGAAPAPPTHAQAAPTAVEFTYTGAVQNWTVPAGVTAATFDVSGAQGGGASITTGGRGGRATATLPVTPGTVVTILVGGAGGSVRSCIEQSTPGAGGFNGGGAGGVGFCEGGGGGGASDVRIGGTALDKRVLVAGGGGGGANRFELGGCGPHDGGGGGGLAGGAGPCGGGAGGNQDSTSGSGQLGQGSAGSVGDMQGFVPAGGGGGGGYWGGAGGIATVGGGGGSGFGPAGVTFFQTGVREGHGLVRVTYPPLPIVAVISPSSGPTGGGTVVTLSGSDFVPGQTSVAFGASPATGVSCPSSTSCTATSPAGSSTVNVTVTTPSGTSNSVPFTYLPPPTLASISPTSGPASGGTVVTISGSGFVPGQTTVSFGGAAATGVGCASATACTATSPPGSDTVNVTVTTPGGTSTALPFTYFPPPALTGLTPSAGPAAGGTVVVLTGAGFSTTPGATTVTFGSNSATGVSCASSTSCTATSPAGSGTVSVRVTVAGQQSADTPAAAFTYVSPPTVSGLSPSAGLAGGGTTVTITGATLTSPLGPTTVTFGASPASQVQCPSPTSCTAQSPPGTGTVEVRVTAGGQISAPGLQARFTYVTPDATAMRVFLDVTLDGRRAPAGTPVRALVGATPCGEGAVGADGQLWLAVATATQLPGCGTTGAVLAFTVSGRAATAMPSVAFVAGGQGKSTLVVGVPPGPMQVSGTALVGGSPPVKATVEALVGGTVCGQATTGAGGAFSLSVRSAGQQAGCGTNGAAVTFRLNGLPATGGVAFASGGAASGVSVTQP